MNTKTNEMKQNVAKGKLKFEVTGMNFLEYGMEYKKSKSKLRRFIAECLLKVEKRRADYYEARLNKRQFSIPDSPAETDAMLRSIWSRIEKCNPDRNALHCSAQNCDKLWRM